MGVDILGTWGLVPRAHLLVPCFPFLLICDPGFVYEPIIRGVPPKQSSALCLREELLLGGMICRFLKELYMWSVLILKLR